MAPTVEAYRSARPLHDWTYRSAFLKFDANGDGSLSPAELRDALRPSCGAATDAIVAALVADFDGDGNGVLDIDELAGALGKLALAGPAPAPTASGHPTEPLGALGAPFRLGGALERLDAAARAKLSDALRVGMAGSLAAACARRDVDAVRTLCERGADAEETDPTDALGRTPLMIAGAVCAYVHARMHCYRPRYATRP